MLALLNLTRPGVTSDPQLQKKRRGLLLNSLQKDYAQQNPLRTQTKPYHSLNRTENVEACSYYLIASIDMTKSPNKLSPIRILTR